MLDLLAEELGTSGRTLRRAADRGLIRAERPSERKLRLPASEATYVRTHWPLLRDLLDALRTQPNVRLAVLFGSTARGDDSQSSDLDVLVDLRQDDPFERAKVVHALEAASDRGVQLVSRAQAEEAPLLLADVVSEGRVLVDREREWPRLQRRRRQVERRASEEDLRLSALAWTAPEALERSRGRSLARDSTHGSGASQDRRQLPRPIKVRLADTRRHYAALVHLLGRTTRSEFVRAARLDDPASITTHVYPLERGFEILSNYVAELNEFGLREAGVAPGDRPTNVRLLVGENVISKVRAQTWRGILGARNELQHEYPDVRAGGIYDAAAALCDDLPGYLRDYVQWMRRLGFGGEA